MQDAFICRLSSCVKENGMRTRVQADYWRRGRARLGLATQPIMRINQRPLLRQGSAGWVIGRRRAVVIRHRKRINKCQVAQRGGRMRTRVGRFAVIHGSSRMLQIKFQASYRAKLQLDFSLLRFFVPFTDRLFGVSLSAQSRQSCLFPQHSTHFTKMRTQL